MIAGEQHHEVCSLSIALVACRQPFLDSGQMVVFGPVLDATGSWGLGVIEAEDEDELRAFAAGDPAVTAGIAKLELGEMLTGFLRPR